MRTFALDDKIFSTLKDLILRTSSERREIDMETTPHTILLVGESGSGKTAFANQLERGKFTYTYTATSGVEFHRFSVETATGPLFIRLCDTAGLEKNKGFCASYYSQADAALVFLDLTSRESFKAVPKWITAVRRINPTIPIMVVCNKQDCTYRRVVTREMIGQLLARSKSTSVYHEISVKLKTNLFTPVEDLLTLITGNAVKITNLQNPFRTPASSDSNALSEWVSQFSDEEEPVDSDSDNDYDSDVPPPLETVDVVTVPPTQIPSPPLESEPSTPATPLVSGESAYPFGLVGTVFGKGTYACGRWCKRTEWPTYFITGNRVTTTITFLEKVVRIVTDFLPTEHRVQDRSEFFYYYHNYAQVAGNSPHLSSNAINGLYITEWVGCFPDLEELTADISDTIRCIHS